jgi:hypothetical protein
MATVGSFAGRLAEVAISSTVPATETTDPASLTYNGIEKVNDPNISGTNDKAETSSNDSGGSKQYIYTFEDATVSFEMIADDSAAQQLIVWTAYLSKQLRGFRIRPRGDSAGDYQVYFLGLVTNISQSNGKGDASKYSVTIQKSSAFTRSTQ